MLTFIHNFILFSGSAFGAVIFIDYGKREGVGVMVALIVTLYLMQKFDLFLERIK